MCARRGAIYQKPRGAHDARGESLEADHKFALTGTPMENRLSSCGAFSTSLMPGLLGPYARFRERFESPIVGGDDAVARRLQAIVALHAAPLEGRRAHRLPDKLESVVYANMDVEQRLYDAPSSAFVKSLPRSACSAKERSRPAAVKACVNRRGARRNHALAPVVLRPAFVYEDYRGPSAKLDAIVDLVSSAVEGGERRSCSRNSRVSCS